MIIEKLRKITKAIMADTNSEVDFDKISAEHKLAEDVGLTSISMLMLVISIEEEFSIELPIKEASQCVTVGDIIKVIEGCLDAKK